ncbi:hypothetical protein [Marinobacter sp. LN3S78]|uniref:hypothetical protein n=1 Tax=Marinobacter sp. LN3S78 TaxID=3382300 RepID=UPI00387B4087
MTEVARARTSPLDGKSFFIAGLMQGARTGSKLANQDYRKDLEQAIKSHCPNSPIKDPAKLMWQLNKSSRESIGEEHDLLKHKEIIDCRGLSPPLSELAGIFHKLTDIAAECDICVACLPNHEPSMGTAAEMYSAYRAGKTVVAITGMTQTLAILACSTIIVPTIGHFGDWLINE